MANQDYNENIDGVKKKEDLSDKTVKFAFAACLVLALVVGFATGAWLGPLLGAGIAVLSYFSFRKYQETVIYVIGFLLSAVASLIIK